MSGISRKLLVLLSFIGMICVLSSPDAASEGFWRKKYKEVKPEDLGLRFEYGPTSREPKHNPNKKTNPDWKTGLVRFFN